MAYAEHGHGLNSQLLTTRVGIYQERVGSWCCQIFDAMYRVCLHRNANPVHGHPLHVPRITVDSRLLQQKILNLYAPTLPASIGGCAKSPRLLSTCAKSHVDSGLTQQKVFFGSQLCTWQLYAKDSRLTQQKFFFWPSLYVASKVRSD